MFFYGLFAIFGFFVVFVLPYLFIVEPQWTAKYFAYPLRFIEQWTRAIYFLLLLPLCIFKRIRRISSAGIVCAGIVFAVILWIKSVPVVYHLWGLVGLIGGLIFPPISMFLAAFGATAINNEWDIFHGLLWTAISAILAAGIGGFIYQKSTQRTGYQRTW